MFPLEMLSVCLINAQFCINLVMLVRPSVHLVVVKIKTSASVLASGLAVKMVEGYG